MGILRGFCATVVCSVAISCSSPEATDVPDRGESDVTTDVAVDAASDVSESLDAPAEDAADAVDAAVDAAPSDAVAPDDVQQDDAAPDVSADVATDTAVDVPPADTALDVPPADVAVDVPPDGPPAPGIGPIEGGLGTVRLILLGDAGEGNEEQYQVAASAARHCDERGGCHALLLLGDNIYDEGPSSATDPLLTEYIDLPYAPMRYGAPPEDGAEDTRPRLPVLAVLGNHDLGGAGLDTALAQHYIAYSRAHSDWFHQPGRTWEARIGPVHVAALDTNPLAYLGTEIEEQSAVVAAATESDAPWSIVIGHHPYRSEGKHGNAGSYEGIPGDLVFLGGAFRRFVDDYICNKADFYISGHDHNRQWMRSVPRIPTWPVWPPPSVTWACGTRFAVSGAGAKTTDFEGRGNDMAFGRETEGFLYMQFSEDQVVVEFCAADGTVEWTETF